MTPEAHVHVIESPLNNDKTILIVQTSKNADEITYFYSLDEVWEWLMHRDAYNERKHQEFEARMDEFVDDETNYASENSTELVKP